jgi:15-cis-phytoene synthase
MIGQVESGRVPSDVRHGEETIRKGSKSFAAAARLFAPQMRADAVLLYAWCRHCDDVIDGQTLGFSDGLQPALPAEARLARLRAETEAALRGVATDRVFAAFGAVMHRHAVPARYPLEHLDGYAMDVGERRYDTVEDTLDYCYGVAGTVGIMMAHIMGVRDEATLGRACDLGLAFQLTNIARDIVEDAAAARVYLPADWLAEAGIAPQAVAAPGNRVALAAVARRLVATAEPFYASAAIGVHALPFRAAWAVATASRVYHAIGLEVVRRGPRAWDSRVATSRLSKLGHVAAGGLLGLRATLSGRPPGVRA